MYDSSSQVSKANVQMTISNLWRKENKDGIKASEKKFIPMLLAQLCGTRGGMELARVTLSADATHSLSCPFGCMSEPMMWYLRQREHSPCKPQTERFSMRSGKLVHVPWAGDWRSSCVGASMIRLIQYTNVTVWCAIFETNVLLTTCTRTFP